MPYYDLYFLMVLGSVHYLSEPPPAKLVGGGSSKIFKDPPFFGSKFSKTPPLFRVEIFRDSPLDQKNKICLKHHYIVYI